MVFRLQLGNVRQLTKMPSQLTSPEVPSANRRNEVKGLYPHDVDTNRSRPAKGMPDQREGFKPPSLGGLKGICQGCQRRVKPGQDGKARLDQITEM